MHQPMPLCHLGNDVTGVTVTNDAAVPERGVLFNPVFAWHARA